MLVSNDKTWVLYICRPTRTQRHNDLIILGLDIYVYSKIYELRVIVKTEFYWLVLTLSWQVSAKYKNN